MKICVVQLKEAQGDIVTSIKSHKRAILQAASFGVDLIFFPELSLTGYEPQLAKRLGHVLEDSIWRPFQEFSDRFSMTIALGFPNIVDHQDVQISMAIFQKEKALSTYSKQFLHADELPYFIRGKQQEAFQIEEHNIAPAICYESLQKEHVLTATEFGADIYMVSVAKNKRGLKEAYDSYPKIASKYAILVLMANSVGHCSEFDCKGRSAIWNKEGRLIACLDDRNEGLLIYDTNTCEALEIMNN